MKHIFLLLLSFFTISCVSAQMLDTKKAAGQEIMTPYAPQTLSFATEDVPLEDSDVAISLINEVLITKYMHSRTMRTLLDSRRYFEIIEPILKANGVPDDFKYLCVAESSLDPNAYSYAKAAGLWQILAATGKQYGLEVNSTVDERYNIEKSTVAACKYLKNAYEKFGNWTLAAASYNCGMAGVSRRKEIQQVDSFYYLFLPTETMRYVYRILTYKILCESPEKLGFLLDNEDYYPSFSYKIEKVDSAVIDWVAFAKSHGTTYKQLRALNSWIREYKHTNSTRKSYSVKIPQ